MGCPAGPCFRSCCREHGAAALLLIVPMTGDCWGPVCNPTRSVHMLDPDGNEIELYVDIADA